MAPSPRLPPSPPDFYALPMFTEKGLRDDAQSGQDVDVDSGGRFLPDVSAD
jgi:hypothetical protein